MFTTSGEAARHHRHHSRRRQPLASSSSHRPQVIVRAAAAAATHIPYSSCPYPDASQMQIDGGGQSSNSDSSVLTPELEAILARGPEYHPMLPEDTRRDDRGDPIYNPAMRLPSWDDQRGILQFLGLAEAMADHVLAEWAKLSEARRVHAAERLLPLQSGSVHQATQLLPSFRFPVTDGLLRVYLAREHHEPTPASSATYESYINGGLSQGLQPEFAVFCGLHKVNFLWQGGAGKDMFFNKLYTKSYREHADQIVQKNAALLKSLWEQELTSKEDRMAAIGRDRETTRSAKQKKGSAS